MKRMLKHWAWIMLAGMCWAGIAVAQDEARPHLLEPGALESLGKAADAQRAEVSDAVGGSIEDVQGKVKESLAEGIQEGVDASDRIHARKEEARGHLRDQLLSKQEELGSGGSPEEAVGKTLHEETGLGSVEEAAGALKETAAEAEQPAPVREGYFRRRGQ